MKPIVLRSFLRQRARQLQREKSLSWHQSLDEAAQEFDHPNYKNYKNALEAYQKEFASNKDLFLKNISSETDISKKIDLAAAFIKDNLIPFTDLVWILEPFKNPYELHLVCEKANLKDDVRTFMLDGFNSESGRKHIASLCQNYKIKELFLVNVRYEISQDKVHINCLYQLVVEPNYNESNSKKIDHSLFGASKMTIDHQDVSLESSCDHEFEEMCHVGSKDYFNMLRYDESASDSTSVGYEHVKQCLSNHEPLTGKTLELALELVDVHGDDKLSIFARNIGTKLKGGQPLDEYEHHILVDMLMWPG